MDALTEKGFRDFMATGVKPVVASVTVVEEANNMDPMFALLANLCAVGMLAKDLHYRAKGKAFYALHLLSDLVYDATRLFDEINEVYYMGEKQVVPPKMSEISAAAVEIVEKGCCRDGEAPEFDQSDVILNCLIDRCDMTAGLVEACKSLAPKSGTNAVLDEVSKKMLQASGLLARTENRPDSPCVVGAEA